MHVHESVKVETARVGYLKSELQHYPYSDLSEHLIRMDRYTTLAARQMFEKGKRATRLELLFHPPIAFARNYILKGGFRDGKAGLIISLVNSYYVMLKFAKLWELQRRLQTLTRRVRPMFSIHVDTARTWRGGQRQVLLTVLGLRERGPPHRARRASRRRARGSAHRKATISSAWRRAPKSICTPAGSCRASSKT